MGYTITEKILMRHLKRKEINSGEFVYVDVDLALGNDVTAPLAISEFVKAGGSEVFSKNKIALVPDHFTPNKDIRSAENCCALRNFALKHDIKNYFEIGQMGIEHVLLPEKGLVGPGEIIIGADSHTCTYGALGAFATGIGSTDLAAAMMNGKVWLKVPETIKFVFHGKLPKWVCGKDLILHVIGDIGVEGALYKSMEFCGPVIENLPMDDRFTMCNMAIEAGGKNGIIAPDKTTYEYMRGVIKGYKPCKDVLKSDSDAKYCDVKEYDVSKLRPQVSFPHLPSNTRNVDDSKSVKIDQVVIGSCTNGRLSDLRIAASILKNKKIAKNIRLIILPGTQKIYLEALKEGLIEIFVNAGGVVSTPTCGPCLGGHMGILAKGERAITTTNRNFAGRMGDVKSEVYLASPATCAASALKGRIASADEVMSKSATGRK